MVAYLLSLLDRDERGQGLAEYALILALIAVLAIAAVTFLGGQINAILSDVGNAIKPPAPQGKSGRRPKGRRLSIWGLPGRGVRPRPGSPAVAAGTVR